jgi:putative hydrolase of the HAD superfamily
MARPRAVLLDLYDTLVWSDWDVLHAGLAGRLGVAPARIVAAYAATRPGRAVDFYGSRQADMAALLAALGRPAADANAIDALVAVEDQAIAAAVQLYDDAVPTVRALRRLGVKVALVSNCGRSTVPLVARLGLAPEFDAVLLSFAERSAKPGAEIFRRALARLGGVAPEQAVFVDDTPGYCDGARALGIATRLILRANEDRPDRTNGHPIIADLASLLA